MASYEVSLGSSTRTPAGVGSEAVEPLGGSTLLEIVEQVWRVCGLSRLPVYVLLGDCAVDVSGQLPSSSGSHACSAVDGL